MKTIQFTRIFIRIAHRKKFSDGHSIFDLGLITISDLRTRKLENAFQDFLINF